jgi:hypothetical protein
MLRIAEGGWWWWLGGRPILRRNQEIIRKPDPPDPEGGPSGCLIAASLWCLRLPRPRSRRPKRDGSDCQHWGLSAKVGEGSSETGNLDPGPAQRGFLFFLSLFSLTVFDFSLPVATFSPPLQLHFCLSVDSLQPFLLPPT